MRSAAANFWEGKMMRKLGSCFLAVACCLAAATAPAAMPARVVCLGDSVTKAVRPGVTEEQTFCALLQRTLTSPARPVEVINAGIGGNTTADGLARFERDVLDRDPDVVVLMFGLNDSWIDNGKSSSRLTVDQYRENLLRMIVTLRDLERQVVLMTPNPAIAPQYDPQRNRTLRPYVDAVRQLARQQQLELVDLYAYFGELGLEGVDLNSLFTDAMHPNPAGQKQIAELLAPRLRELLELP
jgi:acyl-CoA thioesterase-1